ncbi:MAG: Asp23/Gls24 family envelope stress response protein [Clostridiales bacterium]|nr:Asp23/Gls24 family envelope stress response protein [Clostridiales bacterium]
MVREQDGRNTYDIHVDDKLLNVKISDEVIATIAALAATEVEGVAAMSGNITKDLISKLGMKSLSKGVKIELDNEIVEVYLALQVDYGYSIPKVSEAVQDKVKTAIETMTGLSVSGVNIRIASVNVDKNA